MTEQKPTKEKTMSQNDVPSKSDDELRDRIYRLVDEKLIRGMRMIPDDDPIQAQITDSVMELFQVELEARELLGCIQGAEFANNALYDNCPTGDVSAWDMLKGVEKTQKQLNVFVDGCKAQLHKGSQEDKKS